MDTRKIAVVALVVAAGVMIWNFIGKQTGGGAPDGIPVAVTVPVLDEPAMKGESIFAANCVACHGVNASGSENGPPLIHKIYEPNHHADISFLLAVRQGVRAHHWSFGNMPVIDGLSDDDVAHIIYYVRVLQKENGIF